MRVDEVASNINQALPWISHELLNSETMLLLPPPPLTVCPYRESTPPPPPSKKSLGSLPNMEEVSLGGAAVGGLAAGPYAFSFVQLHLSRRSCVASHDVPFIAQLEPSPSRLRCRPQNRPESTQDIAASNLEVA